MISAWVHNTHTPPPPPHYRHTHTLYTHTHTPLVFSVQSLQTPYLPKSHEDSPGYAYHLLNAVKQIPNSNGSVVPSGL